MSEFGHFDADTYRAAQEAPTLTIGSLLYRGRLLSIEQWLVFAGAMDRLRESKAPVHEHVALYRRYLKAVFPRSRFRFWAPDPVEALLKQPYGVVLEAMSRFFDLQLRASKRDPELNQTSGTDSARSTPEPLVRMEVA